MEKKETIVKPTVTLKAYKAWKQQMEQTYGHMTYIHTSPTATISNGGK